MTPDLLHVTAMAHRALAPVLHSICLVCGREYGVKPCVPEMAGQLSHGLCGDECKAEYRRRYGAAA